MLRKEQRNQREVIPENNTVAGNVASSVMIQEKKPTSFKTVGTCRKSKSGNAISIKLISENRFLHISIRDVELILLDEKNITVANVREYEKLETIGVV